GCWICWGPNACCRGSVCHDYCPS
uniref:Conotoxin Cl6c n=1 Tax=Californiconus californicus TaxID=1736779 RepID=U6C_CONCL|nr:RecName: Full=Conotoxin Cl6c; AltName: Full=Cal6.4d [Californiconus californicus]